MAIWTVNIFWSSQSSTLYPLTPAFGRLIDSHNVAYNQKERERRVSRTYMQTFD
uniref:Uncharacterized protein n=1 Tax=Anguilla anguilla TaxID=7936 RepID=A0A0E9RH32_ANGAN